METNRFARTPAGLLCMAEFTTGPHGSTRILCASMPQPISGGLGLLILVAYQRLPAISVFDTAETSGSARHAAADDTVADDIDLQLLCSVQVYLSSVRHGHRPDQSVADAWDRFFVVFSALVRATVVGCRVPADQIDDCVQEAWIEIAQKLPAFRFDADRGRFRGWLYLLVRRKTLKCRRRLDRIGDSPAGSELDVNALICRRFQEPSVACQQREARDQLHAALAEFRQRVSPTTYRVLQLASLEGRSVAEIVQRLGLTPNQVWKLHHRAKAKLRRFLHEREKFLEDFESLRE